MEIGWGDISHDGVVDNLKDNLFVKSHASDHHVVEETWVSDQNLVNPSVQSLDDLLLVQD